MSLFGFATELIHTAILLLALTFGYWMVILLWKDAPHWKLRLVQGVLFGIFGVMNMIDPVNIGPGAFIDGRGLLIGISGAQSGLIAAAITTTIIAIARVIIGGAGTGGGLVQIALVFPVGVLIYNWLQRKPRLPRQIILAYAGMGFWVSLSIITTYFLLPTRTQDQANFTARLLIIVLFPLIAVIMGELIRFQATYQQIIDQKTTERNMLRTLIDNVPDYIFIKDTDQRFLFSNIAHARAAGLTPQELIGKRAEDLFPNALAQKYQADDERVLAGESIIGEERTSLDEQGKSIIVSTTKVPFHDSTGKVRGVIGISRNITEQKLREAQRLQLENERQRIWLLKNFIQNVSHDFRTPLSLIYTSIHLIRHAQDPEMIEQKLERITKQADHITRLLDDMVELVSLDSNEVEFNLLPLDLSDLAHSVITSIQPLVTDKAHRLHVSRAEGISVIGDETHLRIALTHLITNAINYTPDGGEIAVTLTTEGNEAVIHVRDTGIGIPEDEIERIFERLYRVDQARSGTTGGAGIGLPISKTIVSAHHGRLTVESTPGEGSTFSIYLPIHRAEAPPMPTVKPVADAS